MFCPKCGAKNPDGAKFCGACGEPFRSASAPAPAAAPTAAAPGAAPTTFPQAAPTTGKTLPKKTIAIVAGAVVVVVAVVAVALTLFGGGKPFEGTVDLAGYRLVITDKSVDMERDGVRQKLGTIEDARLEDGTTVYELSNSDLLESSIPDDYDSTVDSYSVSTMLKVPDGINSGSPVGEWCLSFDVQAKRSGMAGRSLMVVWADVRDDGTARYFSDTAVGYEGTSDGDSLDSVELINPFSDDFDPEAGGAHVMTASWDKNDDGTYTFVNESGQQTTLTITPSK